VYFDAILLSHESANFFCTVNWTPLFSAADLDPTQFQTAQPTWTSLGDSDVRAAWTVNAGNGSQPADRGGLLQGKPVFFSLIGDWTKPDRMKTPETPLGKKIGQTLALFY